MSSGKPDEFLQEERQISSIYRENSNTASLYNVQYDERTNRITVTISDAQTRQILLGYGVSAEALGSFGLLRSYGVTKIIWYGKESHGNADLYLLKGTYK